MNLSRAGKGGPTNTVLHNLVKTIIQDCGFVFEEEWRVEGTKYRVDFYLPEFHVAVEADGPFHNKKRDSQRDYEIFYASGVYVFRISDTELHKKGRDFFIKELTNFCELARGDDEAMSGQ